MRRPMRSVVPALLAGVAGLCCSVGPALAVPPVVDRCPKDALAVVAIPSVEVLQKNIQSMALLVGQPLPDMNQMLMMAGLEKGLKLSGSAALIVYAPDKEGGAEEDRQPRAVALIPTTDYAALVSNFGVKSSGPGKIDSAKIEGKDVFVKDIGEGFAAVSPRKDVLEAFSGAGGNKAAFEAMVGKNASELSDRSDFSVIINMPVAKPLIEAAMKDRMEQMADQMAMMGGDEPNFAAAEWMVKGFVADSRGAVAGMKIDNLGAGFDFAVAFAEGSRMAKMTSTAGKAGELMAKLPAGAYLLAGAIDVSSPEIKQWLKDFAAQVPNKDKAKAGKKDDQADMMAQFVRNLDTTKGAAFSMGFAPGGIMSGLLSNTVSYTATTDNAAAVAAIKAQFDQAEKSNTAKIKWTAGGQEVAGKKVDVYEMRLLPDPENPMSVQMNQGLFGPMQGPSGYIAQVDGGVLMTFSKSSSLMTSAINAAGGEASLGKDKVVSQVAEKLPPGRFAELYISVKGLFDTVIPFAAMVGMPAPNVDVPDTLPPLALSLAPKAGSIQGTIYLPAPSIKVISEVAKSFQSPDDEALEAGPEGRPQKKEGTGQPGF